MQLNTLAKENEAFHIASSAVEEQLPNKDDVPLSEFWYLSALDVFCQATKDSYENVLAIRKAGVELNEQVKRAMATMSKGLSNPVGTACERQTYPCLSSQLTLCQKTALDTSVLAMIRNSGKD